jgi:hypothetical protein
MVMVAITVISDYTKSAAAQEVALALGLFPMEIMALLCILRTCHIAKHLH